MGVLSNLTPKKVFEFFELCSSVPHGSGNTKQVSDICVQFAKDRGLEYKQDELNNVVIYKPASRGYENAPTVILQGHLDMVCAKYAEDPIDMTREPITLKTDGEWVWADRTSLGGDDMIAVAAALAVLDYDTLEHPALEAMFTVDEETNMGGAEGMNPDWLKGRLMLNMDADDEGVFTVGCAGGAHVLGEFPAKKSALGDGYTTFEMVVNGLLGGHSGGEIHCERGNSNLISARILYNIAGISGIETRLAKFEGGSFDNVIPSSTTTVFAVPTSDSDRALSVANNIADIVRAELAPSDPGVRITIEKKDEAAGFASAADTLNILTFMYLLPNGVQNMSMVLPGLVQTSLNNGIAKLGDDKMFINCFVRSSVNTQKFYITTKVEALIRMCGGAVSGHDHTFPAWEYKTDSPLRETAMKVYKDLFGKDAQVFATHGGLECGLFCDKLPGLDVIAFGPDMVDIHSVKERLNSGSVDRFYRLLCGILKEIK